MEPAVTTTIQPHASVVLGTQPAPGPRQQRPPLVALSAKGCTHALKLRESFKLDAVTSLELGLDFQLESVESGTYHQLLKTAPCAAIQRQLDPEDRSKGVLRADMHHLSFSRRFNLVDGKLPLDAKLGLTYEGKPHVGVGFGNMALTLGLAAALLVAGKPVHLAHKEVGGLAVHFPLSFGGFKHEETLQERVEVDATLRREGRGLRLEVHQLNGVLRLRED